MTKDCITLTALLKVHLKIWLFPMQFMTPIILKFLAQASCLDSWGRWRTFPSPTVTASLTVTSWTFSTQSVPLTWCEWVIPGNRQLTKITSEPSIILTDSRPCDSRNLNLNPLCSLERGPLPKMWFDEVGESKTFVSPPDLTNVSSWLNMALPAHHSLYLKLCNKHRCMRPTWKQQTQLPPTSPPWPAQWEWGTRTAFWSQSQRWLNPHTRWITQLSQRMTTTTPGRRTWLLSTSSLERTLSWVRSVFLLL